MNYKEVSDFEINKMVARAESLTINDGQSLTKRPTAVWVNDTIQEFTFDPCNNPSDAWPVIVENKIGVQFFGDTWMSFAHNVGSRHFYYDKNPLRAAMICFLKMKDAKQ